jgi:hypothetical protein
MNKGLIFGGAVSVCAGLVTIAVGIKDMFFTPDPVVVFVPPSTDQSSPVAPQAKAAQNAKQQQTEPQNHASTDPVQRPQTAEPQNTFTLDLPEPSKPIPSIPADPIPTKLQRVELQEGITHAICNASLPFAFTVAKFGSRADQAIYIQLPKATGRIESNSNIQLSENCALLLVRTGKKAEYFAIFEKVENK